MIGSATATYELRGVNTAFDEKTATWNRATSSQAWTTAGGDYASSVTSSYAGITNDPYRRSFSATPLAQSWVSNPSGDHGVMVKLANETSPPSGPCSCRTRRRSRSSGPSSGSRTWRRPPRTPTTRRTRRCGWPRAPRPPRP
ncbi:DNRLRE domain-containing protein [Nonomuraea thailandensis]